MKYSILFLGLLCAVTFPLYAQEWTPQDSLRLHRLLDGGGEMKLNPDVLKEMGVDAPLGSPKADVSKTWMDFDASLPAMPRMPEKEVVLTLRPYTANTKYNWDPVYQKKITVNKNTWRGDPFYEIRQQRSYTNWARNPMAKGIRKSLEEIQASGVRFRQLSERANGMMVNSVVTDSPIPLFGGSGVYINGGTIGGLDLMAVFTKNFWDKKGRDRRERTLEVLRAYGDSTTVLINKPIEQIIR